MDGGIDKAYRSRFGLVVERRAREAIDRRGGELPVGEALVIPTGDGLIPRLIVAPTMRTPRPLADAEPVYLAMRAAIRCAREAVEPAIERLGVPGLGTGVGRLDPFASAAAIRRAVDELAPTSSTSSG
jgi:O-acetyl-ADP-ribose deacetylase (regulator of RNase III)